MTASTPDHAAPPVSGASRRRWPIILGALVLAVVLPVLFWDWNWLRPLAERQASAALGRDVTIGHLTLVPGRQTVLVADGVRIANAAGFDAAEPFAVADRVVVTWDAAAFLHDRSVVIPGIRIERPGVIARRNAADAVNWRFPALETPTEGTAPRIGAMEIVDGRAHVVVADRSSDFTLAIATPAPEAGKPAQLVADATGTYAGQPIAVHFVGGALLSLNDAATPYPVELHLANGPTTIDLAGTIRDPLMLAGADLKLDLAGPDMALLGPLTGIAMAKTPSYRITGNLDYAAGAFHLRGIAGKIGASDIGGDIAYSPGTPRPAVTGALTSRLIDLADLGGFIGAEPGRLDTPNQTGAQRQAVARAEASPRLLPTSRIDLPAIRETDVHLTYRGDRIRGEDMPFDSLAATIDIVDGHIQLTQLDVAVGKGHIVGSIDLAPQGDTLRAVANVTLEKLDVARLLAATHLVQGSGALGGKIAVTGTGDSMATLVGSGEGTVQVFLASGGNVSALLVNISGFQLGRALLDELHMQNRDRVRCFVGDFTMRRGILSARTLLLDTEDDVVTGTGDINLATETLDLRVTTRSKHFSIGSLPAPIAVTGPIKNPTIRPDLAALGRRVGIAGGLGVLFPPAALLPTIQFGVGDNSGCADLQHQGGQGQGGQRK